MVWPVLYYIHIVQLKFDTLSAHYSAVYLFTLNAVHKGNGNDWIVCLSEGFEIYSETEERGD